MTDKGSERWVEEYGPRYQEEPEDVGIALVRLKDRVKQLEDSLHGYGIPSTSKLELEWVTPPTELEFSPPIGGSGGLQSRGVVPIGAGDIRRMERDFATDLDGPDIIHITPALNVEDYDRGYSEGFKIALNQAISAVSLYMAGHFSSATLEGVIDEIRQVGTRSCQVRREPFGPNSNG